jgi:serine/threonine-protein kinase HipA
MNPIEIFIQNQKAGKLFFDETKREYGFNYVKNAKAISLSMPFRESTYTSYYHLHPIFEMNMPEGYLFEIFKNLLSKEYGYINDFLTLSYLAPNIEGRLRFKSDFEQKIFPIFDTKTKFKNYKARDLGFL